MIKNSHIVIKLEWLNNLNESEKQSFIQLLDKITANIEPHEYYIVNLDEPYADLVKDIIITGEQHKNQSIINE